MVPQAAAQDTTESSQLAGALASFIASDASIEAALESMKLFESIGKGGCKVGS
jgi:hypothetical protein